MLMEQQIFNKKKSKAGFSLVEVLLAIAIFALVSTSIIYLLVDSGVTGHQSKDRITAAALSEEGMEATRAIRDADWAGLFVGNYGLTRQNGRWQFLGEFDTDPTGRFRRQITLSKINDDRFLLISTVTWQALLGYQSNVSTSTYLTNWSKPIAPPEPDWEDPKIFSTIGTNNLAGNKNPADIFVLGNYVYLVTDEANSVDPEFFIFDISNVATPTLVGKCKIGSKINAIYVVGNYAYLATNVNDSELIIIKISNPAQPIVVARINTPGNQDGKDIFVSENYAYLVTQNNPSNSEFYIFDVLEPENPTTIPTGKLELSAEGRNIYISGNYAYVGTDNDNQELLLLNIIDKKNPQIASTYNNPGSANTNGVFVSGNSVYLAFEQNGASNPNVAIINVDISNPSNITINLVGQFHNSADVNGLWPDASTNQIFLANADASKEFIILDMTNPAALVEKIAIDLPSQAVAITYSGAYVFVATIANNQELIIIGPG